MSLGVLGGTFDPVHVAHLRLAEETREILGLARVLFVPARRSPLKIPPVADARDRLQMLKLATASNPAFDVLELDLQREGASYAIDTLRDLAAQLAGERLWFILGSDSALELERWREPEALFGLASFAVVPRPGSDAASVGALLPARLARSFRRGVHGLVHETGSELRSIPATPLAISATDIRRRIARGASIRYLVPDAVAEYISKQRLYVEDA